MVFLLSIKDLIVCFCDPNFYHYVSLAVICRYLMNLMCYRSVGPQNWYFLANDGGYRNKMSMSFVQMVITNLFTHSIRLSSQR